MKHKLQDRSPAWKIIEIKVCGMPDGVEDIMFRQRARPGHAYGEKSVDEAIWKVAKVVDEKFPAWDFHMVELAPNRFNFVFSKVRQAKASTIEQAAAMRKDS